jgi:hypothetical protein
VDASVRAQAKEVLSEVERELREGRVDVRTLPDFAFQEGEDGSFAIEWRFRTRRLAFTIEGNRDESAWHIVTSLWDGGWSAFGPLASRSVREILEMMLRR